MEKSEAAVVENLVDRVEEAKHVSLHSELKELEDTPHKTAPDQIWHELTIL